MYGIVVSESVRVAGDRLDDAIMQYVKRRYNLVIGERTAEEMKVEIGAAVPLDTELKMDVRGRDQITGLPKTVTVQSSDVTAAIQDSLATIVSVARGVLERTPPELASDVIDRGIVLTGGGALLRQLDILLTQETGIPCQVAENPLDCVAIGSGVALEYLDVIKRSLPTEEETLVASY
jgi:rod shape-determining protein MreB